jgi:hypothetical protein
MFPPSRSVVLSLLLIVTAVSCSESSPGDSLETSDQAVSVSPTTVYPTPASSPSPGASTGVIARWCEELAEAVGDQDRALDIYREGTDLPEPALAAAAEVLSSRSSAEDRVEEAGRQVEGSCERRGVDLTD